MHETIEFLLRYGYSVLFGAVLAEQIGLPIPSVPVMLSMGALAGAGAFSLQVSLGLMLLASLIGDAVWYWLGRRRGQGVLRLLCKIALEPDSCVRMTRSWFDRLGASTLVIAKFVPGLSTAAPPMAGVVRMPVWRFVLADSAGSLLYGGAFLLLGYMFSNQLEDIAAAALHLGSWGMAVLAALLVGYIGWKFYQRRRFLKSLEVARIRPEEVKAMLDKGEDVVIVDVRSAAELRETGKLRGALWLNMKALEEARVQIPRDRDVILYCSCPNEATAAKAALLLRGRGITRVRPMEGGYDAWRDLGYPLEPFVLQEA